MIKILDYIEQSEKYIESGGRGRIRTHGPREGPPVFKTGAIGHSATLPQKDM